jgi:hypothetical protein
MPGISGFVTSHAPLACADEVVSIFQEVHALRNIRFVNRVFRSQSCVITNTLTGLSPAMLDQPAVDSTGDTLLFLEGQIYNCTELARYLGETNARTPCEILLALFLVRGPDFVSLVDGDFNLVIYQKTEQRLTLLNDHLSSKPLYYLEQDNGLLFGSEKKSILALTNKPPTLDPVGIIQLFAYRHNVGGKTLINGLACLPPACRLEYQRGRLQLTRYALPEINTQKRSLRVEPLLEEWCSLLKAATNRRLPDTERIVISLSGGLDSRAIACAIPRDQRPLAARTRGAVNELEVQYATTIAKRLGFDHFREEPFDTKLSEILPKIVWRTECAVPFTHGMTLPSHTLIKQFGDFMTGGWLGDASSGAHLAEFMFLPYSRRQFIDKVYQRYIRNQQYTFPLVFQEEFLSKHLPGLYDSFVDSFTPLATETNWQAYDIWDLYERQARMTIGAGPVDSHLFEYARPFLDRTYMTFVLSVPTPLRYGQVLYQAMIHRIGPEVRDVPNANTDLKLAGTIAGNVLNKVIARKQRIKSKLSEKLIRKQPNEAFSASQGDLNVAIRRDEELRRRIELFVHSDVFDPSIFHKTRILSMLDQHYRGVHNYSYPITVLATLAVGLPYFVAHRPSRCPTEAEPVA